MNETPRDDARYRAFISYSHQDRDAARRLHRQLETYRMPRRLVGTLTTRGPVPRRLAPLFRDREELPAAHDLTAEVRSALAASASLLVIASPAAAASAWVDREIALFRALHPDRPILTALIAGEPAAAFPPSLRGAAGDRTIEPLAADFRRGGDGARLGRLKLVAGIVGLPLDDLVQRDAQRRMRSVIAITLASLAAVLAMAVLTGFALAARADAERQRQEAEGLVEFMLTDLRTRLEGVGRLDVLGAVNLRALDYYERQSLATLPPDSIERRARLFHAMGEDDEKRGRLDLALAKFREAHRATAALLARAPDDPERVFAHSQSAYWLGYADYQRQRFDAARAAFVDYRRLADRLVSLRPADPGYRAEAAYAEGNLCALALTLKPKDGPAALDACAAALVHMQQAAARLPPERRGTLDADIANRHVWLGDALVATGQLARAEPHYRAQERIIDRLIAADPRNLELRDTWITIQTAGAKRAAGRGDTAEARRRLERASAVIANMITFDPENRRWLERQSRIARELLEVIP